MAVNLPPPDPALAASRRRRRARRRHGRHRRPNRKDLLVMRLGAGQRGRRRLHAEPLLRRAGARLQEAPATNEVARARRQHRQRQRRHRRGRAASARAASARRSRSHLGCEPEQVLPFSTGVIMEPLPVERIVAGAAAAPLLRKDDWLSRRRGDHDHRHGAEGVLAQGAAVDGGDGDGHRHRQGRRHDPARHGDDARLRRHRRARSDARPAADARARVADARSTASRSTATPRPTTRFILVATGARPGGTRARRDLPQARGARSPTSRDSWRRRSCATARARPSSSPSRVEGGRNVDECRRVAYAIAHSPLVKTAFFASDPNLGRILAAIGYAGVAAWTPRRSTSTSTTCCVAQGGGRDPGLPRGAGGRGDEEAGDHGARGARTAARPRATVWTCDFSYDYVKINADYRT